jgi:FkbM family methyltransferase
MNFAFTLGSLLLRVRPAPLAAAAKRGLRIRRQTVTTPAGVFWLDPASDAGQRVWRNGAYDPAAAALFARLLRPGDTYVDIGANEGFLCVAAGRLVGPGGRVIAVEPQERLQPVLRRNLELNGVAASVWPMAVSDHAGSAELHLTPDVNNSASGLAAPTRYALARQTVPLLTLAQLLDRIPGSGRPVVKMDIEGFEHEAILGSPAVFRERRISHLVLELHPPLIARRGLDPEAVPAFLRSCGYDLLPDAHGLVWAAPGCP